MNKLGSIIIIDNDLEDLELINDALALMKVNNKILLFSRATEFLKHLRDHEESPFFILCDINMPNMDGFQLLQEISNNPVLKSICFPFIFLSTSASRSQVEAAYKMNIQGYFKKPVTFEGIVSMLEGIITYWDYSYRPFTNDSYTLETSEIKFS